MSIHRKELKGRVSYQVQWRDHAGQQRAQRFRTRKDAEAFQAQLNLNKYQGLLPSREGTKVTFGEYAKRWQQRKETTARGRKVSRPRTIKRRSEILRLHLLPIFSEQTLASITTGQINDQINAWQKAGLKPRTIRNHIYVLRPILELAVSEQLITRNPVDGVELPEPDVVKRSAIDPEQIQSLLNEIPENFRAFVITGFMTGMRFDELASLRIGAFDFQNKSIRVEKSKTESGVRNIFLSEDEFKFLNSHISTTRPATGPKDLIFVTAKSQKINHSNFMKRVFKPAARRAGIPDVTPHDMRRTHATFLAESGLDQTTVHIRMGHSSFSTTQKYYVSPTERGQIRAAGVVSNALNLPLVDEGEQP